MASSIFYSKTDNKYDLKMENTIKDLHDFFENDINQDIKKHLEINKKFEAGKND